jgi:hypothetical protein
VLFTFLTIVPVVALTWLTALLINRDKTSEAAERQSRVARAADLVVAAIQRRPLELEDELLRLVGAGAATPAETRRRSSLPARRPRESP